MPSASLNYAREYPKERVYVDETSIVPAGAAVCLDIGNATVAKRSYYAKKPTLQYLPDLHGIVVEQGKHASAGPKEMDVAPIGNGIMRGQKVLTDENIAVGDLLGPIPGTYYWGKAVCCRPFARAVEAVDGSSTPALVTCDVGLGIADEIPGKLTRWFDHFDGTKPLIISGFTPAEVATAGWILAGSGATGAYGTGNNAVSELGITGATTVIAQLRNSGLQMLLSTGKSVFFRARLKIDAITQDIFAGLAIAGTVMTDTTSPTALTDYIGMYVDGDAGTPAFALWSDRGNSNPSAAIGTSAAALVAATYTEVAFLVRNKIAGDAAGSTDIKAWVDNVKIVDTQSAANAALINKTAAMGLVFATIGSAPTLTIDRVECNYYHG